MTQLVMNLGPAAQPFSDVSCDQVRLLHLWRAHPSARTALNIGSAARLRGPLQRERLQRSLRDVVARHTSLRTSFIEDVKGGWSRQVNAALASELEPLPPLSTGPGGADTRILNLLDTMLEEPIDPTRAPLWRVRLVPVAPQEHGLIFVCHHVISDHRSVAEFFYELLRHYDADGSLPPAGPDAASADELALEQFLRREQEALAPERLAFWKELIAGTKPVPGLARDELRSVAAAYQAGTLGFQLPLALWRDLQRALRERNLRPSAVLLAAFASLVHRRSGVAPFLVGVAVDGRSSRSVGNAMGSFSTPSVVRVDPRQGEGPLRLAGPLQRQLMAVLRRRPFPHVRLSALIRAEQGLRRWPSMQYLFSFVLPEAEHFGLHLSKLHGGASRTSFDLWLTMQERAGSLAGQLDYARPLFQDHDARALSEELLEIVAEDLPRAPSPAAAAAVVARPVWSLAVAGTFTIDPLPPALAGWGRYFDQPLRVELAAPGPIEACLLRSDSVFAAPDRTANLLLLRAADFTGDSGRLDNLCEALRGSVRRNPGAHLVCIAPSPDLVEAEAALARRLAEIPRLHVIAAEEVRRLYPVSATFDASAESLADIPFSSDAYLALATLAFRKLVRLRRPSTKVIVVDGDDTLWGGVLGEDGCERVTIEDGHRALHRCLLEQRSAGVLLCLCSKNDPALVQELLAKRRDCLLAAEHFVGSRVNWLDKSENLRSLAEELKLGLDSFLLLDNSPLEIAEVSARLPEVLCVQTPAQVEQLPDFLAHLWPLDSLAMTAEDRARNGFYQAEKQRTELAAREGAYLDFLAKLAVEVRIDPLAPTGYERAAQLAARTTQFNINGRKWTANELESFLRGPAHAGWVVSVRDRYGDYGTVGLMLTSGTASQELVVEQFLLSCRALGRGVEHQMISHLARTADSSGCQSLIFRSLRTARNTPAFRFLEELAIPAGITPEIMIPVASALAARPGPAAPPARSEPESVAPAPGVGREQRRESERFQQIAHQLRTVAQIRAALGLPAVPRPLPDLGAGPTLAQVMGVLRDVLGRSDLDPQDDFFAMGGTSLQAIEALSLLCRAAGRDVDAARFFQNPTGAGLLQALQTDGIDLEEAAEAELMLADAELPPDIRPSPVSVSAEIPALGQASRVLLTGATGFLGGELLVELLRGTNLEVHCLVRAATDQDALQRIEARLEEAGMPRSALVRKRLRCHAADIRQPGLGLSPERRMALAEQIDVIFHCGAEVTFARSYRSLRAANVAAIEELLRLAGRSRIKPLHFISSLGVLHDGACPTRPFLEEAEPPGLPLALPTGYQRTKWVAERKLARARERGLPITIYRPAAIVAHSRRPGARPQDLWWAVMSSAIQAAELPDVPRLDFLPVDLVAKAIVAIARTNQSNGRIFNLAHPQPPAARTVRRWALLAGLDLRLSRVEDWIESARRRVAAASTDPLHPFAPLLAEPPGRPGLLRLLLEAPPVRSDNTRRALQEAGVPINVNLSNLLARLFRELPPARQPLLRFPEHLTGFCMAQEKADLPAPAPEAFAQAFALGRERRQVLRLDLQAEIGDLYQLIHTRTITVRGQLICSLLGDEPLTIVEGSWQLRPAAGLSGHSGAEALFMSYQCRLAHLDGRSFELRGVKRQSLSRDFWRQVSTLDIELHELVPAGSRERVRILGQVAFEMADFVADQIRQLTADPGLAPLQQRYAQVAWLTFLGANIGRNYLDLALRALQGR